LGSHWNNSMGSVCCNGSATYIHEVTCLW